jgi:KipI family sensor histidine kinase inhibitor
MRFEIASYESLIIYFGDEISSLVAQKVRQAYGIIKGANLNYCFEIIPSYTTIFIRFDFMCFSFDEIVLSLKALLQNQNAKMTDLVSRNVIIPVFYSPEVGEDLESLADEKKLSVDDVIRLHVNKEYFVYAIGFAPGFAYMGEVDKKLATPRHANPRLKVPKGSVALADEQTAIYPKQSPGGWQILGRTPLEMFHPSYEGFSYLKVGDKVRFEPISREKFLQLGGII